MDITTTRPPSATTAAKIAKRIDSQTIQVHSRKELYFGALFPFSSDNIESQIAWGAKPAIDLALQHVNEHSSILHSYNLQMKPYDTKCEMADGTKAFFEAMAEGPIKMMVFGGVCSNVTAPIAEAVIWWKLVQLSYANTEPFLSEREKYPTFFRTVPSETNFNPAKLKLLQHFNWTTVATIHQDAPRFSVAHNKLSRELEDADIKLLKVASFVRDPVTAVQEIYDSGARIILGYFDEEMARKVFCYAFKKNMYGKKYAWILPGWYHTNWWNSTSLPDDCAIDDIYEASNGYLATDIIPLSKSGDATISGLTANDYEQMYHGQRGDNFTILHGYAYDGVWVIAAALNAVLHRLGNNQSALLDFKYDDECILQMFMEAMNETDFVGVTGPVRFKDGNRLGTIMYEQFQAGTEVKIGEFYAYSDAYNLSLDQIIWAGGSPPRDQPLILRTPRGISFVMYLVMCCLSYIGIMMAAIFLFFNMRFRQHRYIKMSSPYINNLIIIGGILCYASIFVIGFDSHEISDLEFRIVCSARSWLLAIGFTLAFGAMFSKTWRVHSIFTNIKMKKRVIKDQKLFIIVAVLLLVDVVILVSWEIKDPMKRKRVEIPEETDSEEFDEIYVIAIIQHCESIQMTIWLAAIYVYKGVLMVFGCFLAWETRRVSIPALNDSKYIGMSVYNIVVTCMIGAALSFVIHNDPSAAFCIISLFILFCTTITLCLVFVPKLLELRRDPRGEDRKFRCTSTRGSFKIQSQGNDSSAKLRYLRVENVKLRKSLAEKDKEVSLLLEKLGLKPSNQYEPSHSYLPETTTVTFVVGTKNGDHVHDEVRETDIGVWSDVTTHVYVNPIENTAHDGSEYYEMAEIHVNNVCSPSETLCRVISPTRDTIPTITTSDQYDNIQPNLINKQRKMSGQDTRYHAIATSDDVDMDIEPHEQEDATSRLLTRKDSPCAVDYSHMMTVQETPILSDSEDEMMNHIPGNVTEQTDYDYCSPLDGTVLDITIAGTTTSVIFNVPFAMIEECNMLTKWESCHIVQDQINIEMYLLQERL
ncbi:gamma-aminobutyric acid type B receptor subunit 2-like [Glandiceps talaboti]